MARTGPRDHREPRVAAAANAARGGAASAILAVADDGRLATITSDPPGEQRGITVSSIYGVAQPVARKYSVLDRDEAWAALERALLNDAGVRGSGLIALWVTDVRVGPEDRSLAEEQESLRRETALAQTKAENMRVLLADPTTARLWWLENSPGKLEKLAEQKMDGIFEKVAALIGQSTGRPAADPITEVIRLFLQGLDGRFRERQIDQLRLVFSAYERDDLAARLDTYQL